MKSRFDTLCVSRTIDCYSKHVDYHWKVRSGPMLHTDDIRVVHDFIWRASGESLHTIIVRIGIYDEEQHGTQLMDDFRRACPNVWSLSVAEDRGLWVTKFAADGQLEKLENATNNPVLVIPERCPSLVELVFSPVTTPFDLELIQFYVEDIDWARDCRFLILRYLPLSLRESRCTAGTSYKSNCSPFISITKQLQNLFPPMEISSRRCSS